MVSTAENPAADCLMNGGDFAHTQYLPCGYGTQCKYGTACTRAHSDPPEAEIAYWNWKQPLRASARRRRGTSERVTRSEIKREGFLCQVCQVVMNSYSQLLQHLSGAKHKAQAEAAALTSEGFNDDPDSGGLSADELADPDTLSAAHLTHLPHLLGIPSISDGSSPMLHRHAHLARSPGAYVSPSGTAASQSPRGITMKRRPLSAPGSPRLGLSALSRPSRSDRTLRTQPTTALDTQLIQAVLQGYVNAAQEAVNAGANVNARREGAPALHWAVAHQHVEMALFLVSLGASRDDTDREHQTALHIALQAQVTSANARLSILRALLTQGWNANAQNRQGRTPLHLCVDRCDLDAAELLLKARANPHLSDALGYTPLLLAGWRMQKKKSPEGQKMHQLLSSWISALPSESNTASSSSNAAAVLAAAGRTSSTSSTGPNQGVSIKHLEQVAPTFKPLFKALALFPYGASVELWRLSGLLKPIVTRLNIKRKAYVLQAQDAGYVTVHQSDNQKQLYVRVAPPWRHVLEPDTSPTSPLGSRSSTTPRFSTLNSPDGRETTHHRLVSASDALESDTEGPASPPRPLNPLSSRISDTVFPYEKSAFEGPEGVYTDDDDEDDGTAGDDCVFNDMKYTHGNREIDDEGHDTIDATVAASRASLAPMGSSAAAPAPQLSAPSLAEVTMGSSVPASLTPMDPAVARSLQSSWATGERADDGSPASSAAALPTRPPQGMATRRRPASAGGAARSPNFNSRRPQHEAGPVYRQLRHAVDSRAPPDHPARSPGFMGARTGGVSHSRSSHGFGSGNGTDHRGAKSAPFPSAANVLPPQHHYEVSFAGGTRSTMPPRDTDLPQSLAPQAPSTSPRSGPSMSPRSGPLSPQRRQPYAPQPSYTHGRFNSQGYHGMVGEDADLIYSQPPISSRNAAYSNKAAEGLPQQNRRRYSDVGPAPPLPQIDSNGHIAHPRLERLPPGLSSTMGYYGAMGMTPPRTSQDGFQRDVRPAHLDLSHSHGASIRHHDGGFSCQPLRSAPPSVMTERPHGASHTSNPFGFDEQPLASGGERGMAPQSADYKSAGMEIMKQHGENMPWSQGSMESRPTAPLYSSGSELYTGQSLYSPMMQPMPMQPPSSALETAGGMSAYNSHNLGLVGPPGGFFGDHVWASTEHEKLHEEAGNLHSGGNAFASSFHHSGDFGLGGHTMFSSSSDIVLDDLSAGWLAGVEDVLADTPSGSVRPNVDRLAGHFAASHI